MSTFAFKPQPKSQLSGRCLWYRADGSFPSDEDHSGQISLNYRGLTRVGLFIKGTGTNPTGSGTLAVYGVVDDDASAGDQAFKFAPAYYWPVGVAQQATLTTAIMTGTLVPAVTAASGALCWLSWDYALTGPNTGPYCFRELLISYDKGTASDTLTLTEVGILAHFSEG